jgi:hypothetical protein
VLGVFADDTNDAAAMNDFALIADLLDGRANLHGLPFEYAGVNVPAWKNWMRAVITSSL